MDRDEQRGLARTGELHALSERNECIVVAGHEYAVLAGLFYLVAQQQRKLQDDGLLHLSARRPRPVVDAAVAGIDHDQRAGISIRFDLDLRVPLAPLWRPTIEREVAHEGVAVRRRQMPHKTRATLVSRIENEGQVDMSRP